MSVFVSSSLLATCHMGSPLGLVTEVHNVGEDGGEKKDQKAVKFSLLSKFLLDDLV